jgi:hypothetical protein
MSDRIISMDAWKIIFETEIFSWVHGKLSMGA